jgi:integrase/recombinase XerD
MKRGRTVLTLARAIDRFLVEFEDAKGATPDTLHAYRWTLERMGGVLGWDRDPLTITSDDLLDVLGAWRKLSTSSRANRVSVMRTFFSWLAERYDVVNPAANLHRPKKQRKARKRLTSDDVYRLMRACESDRDKVVVYLLAMTGMRRGDLRKMRWRDVNFKQRMLIIPLGKGRKGREVPLPPPLVSLLRDVAGRLQESGEYHPDNYVSPRTIDHPMPTGGHAHKVYHNRMQGEAAAYKLLHRLAVKAGVQLPLSPHDLRRYYAGFFLETNPGDLFRLQAVMGHADIGTTRTYLPDADMPKVQEAVDRMDWTVPVELPESVEKSQ